MAQFVFSADGHIKEPTDLFLSNIPPSMHKYTLRSEKSGEYVLILAGDKVLFRNRLKPANADIANFGRPNQKGAVDLDARLEDMRSEGIDAEILFPTSGMMTCREYRAISGWVSSTPANRPASRSGRVMGRVSSKVMR